MSLGSPNNGILASRQVFFRRAIQSRKSTMEEGVVERKSEKSPFWIPPSATQPKMSSSLIQRVSTSMQKFAPLTLAETSWDNVGILLESPVAINGNTNKNDVVMLAIDLTDKVLQECVKTKTSVLVAYHPPIFSGLKRLTLADPKQALVLKSVANGISIYSPHTSLDACKDGINDWLAQGLSPENEQTRVPIKAAVEPPVGQEGSGMGRLVTLNTPVSFDVLLGRIKKHLSLAHVRVAKVKDEIKTVAICAGSGGSLLAGVKADLYFSGEMGHHEILAANSKGSSVILCEHTNTERGYLKAVLQAKLQELLGAEVQILVSEEDKDPITIV